jgi:hypothetical protein
MLVLAVFAVGAFARAARAQACPNEQLRGQDGYALALPDCRAYEQVSPAAKNFTDALGEADVVQNSPSGDGVTFFSIAPFPGLLSATGPSLYLGTRAGGEWSTRGLVPPTVPRSQPGHGSASVRSLTEDLSEALILVEPGLEAGVTPGRYSYLRDSANGSFQLLGPGIARFAGATAGDSRIIFESREQLLPEAAPGVVNLYEWTAGRLILVGILPASEGGKVPAGGSLAGPGGSALGAATGGATGGFYTQNTISADGSRVFFSDVGTGRIYMREPEATRTIPVSAGQAYWRAATADGRYVFYTEAGGLYRWCKRVLERAPCEGEHEEGEPVTTQVADASANVLGTLGVSTEDGSYAYFVATGVLAGNENGNREKAEADKANLYEWHNGETIFIARLNIESEYDEYDWLNFYRPNLGAAPAAGEKSSRVTPDGTTLLFTSRGRLTSYDNAGQGEIYVYDAASGGIACVSCNPSAASASSEASLAGNLSIAAAPERNAFLTRNLSEDGNRVFFQTKEALVPQDTNSQTDVYEWEREGAGSCEHASASFSATSGGCLYLISTGQSGDQSYFGDASTDGKDVFFFTRQSLVGQDQDDNTDIYDARVEGGIAAQNPPSAASCTGEGCLGPVDPSPVVGVPSSTALAASGNLPDVKPEPLTRAQELAKALRACRQQPRRKRRSCQARAKKRYGKRATKPARKR